MQPRFVIPTKHTDIHRCLGATTLGLSLAALSDSNWIPSVSRHHTVDSGFSIVRIHFHILGGGLLHRLLLPYGMLRCTTNPGRIASPNEPWILPSVPTSATILENYSFQQDAHLVHQNRKVSPHYSGMAARRRIPTVSPGWLYWQSHLRSSWLQRHQQAR